MRHTTLVTSHVRRHMAQLPQGSIFTTRELLRYGIKRASLDQALSRMVKRQEIERLALGVFRKYSWTHREPPSAAEIARAKAAAYKKELVMHGADAAHQLKLLPSGNAETTFATDGRSSSFRTVSGPVHLKQVSPRKLYLGDTPVGLLIRAIVFIGKHAIDLSLLNTTLSLEFGYGREERRQMRRCADLAPAWVSDVLCAA
jgi:hypothetical protein